MSYRRVAACGARGAAKNCNALTENSEEMATEDGEAGMSFRCVRLLCLFSV